MKHAPEKTYEQKNRSIRTSTANLNAGEWLKLQYTDAGGQMFCQLCQKDLETVSFKKRNGDFYFESVEIFRKEIFSFEHESLFVALCPLCAAKYKEYVKRDSDIQNTFLKELKTSDCYEFPIKCEKETINLKFVETHYIDLTAALDKNSGKT